MSTPNPFPDPLPEGWKRFSATWIERPLASRTVDIQYVGDKGFRVGATGADMDWGATCATFEEALAEVTLLYAKLKFKGETTR